MTPCRCTGRRRCSRPAYPRTNRRRTRRPRCTGSRRRTGSCYRQRRNPIPDCRSCRCTDSRLRRSAAGRPRCTNRPRGCTSTRRCIRPRRRTCSDPPRRRSLQRRFPIPYTGSRPSTPCRPEPTRCCRNPRPGCRCRRCSRSRRRTRSTFPRTNRRRTYRPRCTRSRRCSRFRRGASPRRTPAPSRCSQCTGYPYRGTGLIHHTRSPARTWRAGAPPRSSGTACLWDRAGEPEWWSTDRPTPDGANTGQIR